MENTMSAEERVTIVEFYEKKAIECGYDNFLHWIDCYPYELQPMKIIEWTRLQASEAVRQERERLQKLTLKAIENAYRKGILDGKETLGNAIVAQAFLVTSQVVAYKIFESTLTEKP